MSPVFAPYIPECEKCGAQLMFECADYAVAWIAVCPNGCIRREPSIIPLRGSQ